ncbi:MAG: hypothetical protein ACT4TC_21085, partial [Myxococcaceae bacterium]
MLPLLCAAFVSAAPVAREVPTLRALPKLDGKAHGIGQALALPIDSNGTKLLVGAFKGTLYVGVEIKDDVPLPADSLKIELHFPAGGVGTEALTFEASALGLRVIPVDAPDHLKKLIQAERGPGFVEVVVPARALPRFPAKVPLVFDLCATYADVDEPATPAKSSSNCELGSMKGGPLTLPESFRKPVLDLKPPERVAAFEGRDGAWVAYETGRFPLWVAADKDLTALSLSSFVATAPVDFERTGMAISQKLSLADGRPLIPVVAGSDPFASLGRCEGEAELRLGLYLSKGKTAVRVLEWPVATCSMGRALSVVVD